MWITKAGLTAGIFCLGFAVFGVGVVALKTSAAPSASAGSASTGAERSVTAAEMAGPLTIQQIRITGNHQVSTADILNHVKVKAGDVLNSQQIQNDTIVPIYNMGEFDLVGPYEFSTLGNGKVIVTVPVTEKLMTIPAVTSPLYFEDIRITGNYRVPTADILKHVAIKPGDIADGQRRAKVDQAVASIKAMNEFDMVGPYTVIQSYPNRVIITIPVVEKPVAK